MSKTLADDVQGLLNLPKATQDQIFKQFANLEKPERIAVLEKHRIMLFRLKNLHLPQSITDLSYVSLIFAIIQYKEERKKIAKQNYEGLSLEEIGELNDFEGQIYKAKNERPCPQTETVMKYWGTVVRLKNQGFGFRDIAGILEDKYGVTVSFSTVARAWKRMKNLEKTIGSNV
jgi:hypothetical protein